MRSISSRIPIMPINQEQTRRSGWSLHLDLLASLVQSVKWISLELMVLNKPSTLILSPKRFCFHWLLIEKQEIKTTDQHQMRKLLKARKIFQLLTSNLTSCPNLTRSKEPRNWMHLSSRAKIRWAPLTPSDFQMQSLRVPQWSYQLIQMHPLSRWLHPRLSTWTR